MGDTLARAYLTPPSGTFWHWSSDGRAVTWGDGTTIAFRQEVEAVLGRLAPLGLPPFGSIVLLLAACRDSWRETAARTGMYEFARLLERQRGRDVQLGEVFERLDGLSAFDPELRAGIEAKCRMAEAVFEGAPGIGAAEDAARIVAGLRGGLGGDDLQPDPRLTPLFGVFDQDLAPLAHGLAGLDPSKLAWRARTGLDGPLAPADEVAEVHRDLVARLLDDPELAGFARVARDVMAVTSLPTPVGVPETLPLGGFSDIANRGPLDRLLVSELAQDDLALAARIALGEALYLRRETPPRAPARTRTILLDAGVRLWGIPRVFATAVGLALAAKGQPGLPVRVRRAQGERVVPVDLATRAGLLDHLAALEPEPHPGAALAAFLLEARAGGEGDAIVVTHADVLEDPAFRAVLPGRLHVATVDAEGAYRLVEATPRGRVVLGQARLSIEDVAPAERSSLIEPQARTDGELPVYFGLWPKPLRVPHAIDPRQAAVSGQGILSVAQARATLWDRADLGPREVASSLPGGHLHWLDVDGERGMGHVLVGRGRNHWIPFFRIDLASGWSARIDLPASGYPPLAVFRQRSALFLVFRDRIDLFDLDGGERIDTFVPVSGQRHLRGRFFAGPRGASALSFDGTVARFEPIRGAAPDAFLFDRPGRDGPWCLQPGVGASSLATGEIVRFACLKDRPVRVLAASADGDRLVVGTPDGSWMLDLARPGEWRWTGDPHLGVEPAIGRANSFPYHLAKNHRAIGIDDEGCLSLLARKGARRRLVLAGGALRYGPSGGVGVPGGWHEFQTVRGGLRLARFPDGSRAYVAPSGLLHLVPARRDAPELALALSDKGVAVWTSSGHLCGPPYLIGDAPTTDVRAIDREIEAFLRRAAP